MSSKQDKNQQKQVQNKRDILCYTGIGFIVLVYAPYIYYSVRINQLMHEHQVKDGYSQIVLCEWKDFWISVVSAICFHFFEKLCEVTLTPVAKMVKRDKANENEELKAANIK